MAIDFFPNICVYQGFVFREGWRDTRNVAHSNQKSIFIKNLRARDKAKMLTVEKGGSQYIKQYFFFLLKSRRKITTKFMTNKKKKNMK